MFKNESLVRKFYHNYISRYKTNSYSQEGEDRILQRIFEGKPSGFYIDIGAHHPFRFSNTYLFYRQGWKGINIEANPDSLTIFNKFRPRDLNLNVAIGTEGPSLTYYKFEEPALNSFDQDLSLKRSQEGWKILNKLSIPIKSLSSVLETHLKENQKIDFMTIDVEGLDFEVLKSNNWNKFRPDYLLVECLNTTNFFEDPVYKFLTEEQNYKLYSKAVNTFIFKATL